MNKKSIWAVVAGVLVIIIVTTVVDIALHALGVFPPLPAIVSPASSMR